MTGPQWTPQQQPHPGWAPQQVPPGQQWWSPGGQPPPAKRKRRGLVVLLVCAAIVVAAAGGLAVWRVIAMNEAQGIAATDRRAPAECALGEDTLRALHITVVQQGDTWDATDGRVRTEANCQYATEAGTNGSGFRSLSVEVWVAEHEAAAEYTYGEQLSYLPKAEAREVDGLGDRATTDAWGDGYTTNVAVVVQRGDTTFLMVYFGFEMGFFGKEEVPVESMREDLMRAAREMAGSS